MSEIDESLNKLFENMRGERDDYMGRVVFANGLMMFVPFNKDYLPRVCGYEYAKDWRVKKDIELQIGEVCRVSFVATKTNRHTQRGKYGIPEWDDIVEWLTNNHHDLLKKGGYIKDGKLTMTEDQHRMLANRFSDVVVDKGGIKNI